MPSARGKMGYARRLRVKNGGSHSDERSRAQNHKVMGRMGEKDESGQGQTHPAGERVRLRPSIGVEANERLQDRRGHLKSERDQTDLDEAEMKARLQQWIDRRDERLNRVVEEMGKADREKDREDKRLRASSGSLRLALREMRLGDR